MRGCAVDTLYNLSWNNSTNIFDLFYLQVSSGQKKRRTGISGKILGRGVPYKKDRGVRRTFLGLKKTGLVLRVFSTQ